MSLDWIEDDKKEKRWGLETNTPKHYYREQHYVTD